MPRLIPTVDVKQVVHNTTHMSVSRRQSTVNSKVKFYWNKSFTAVKAFYDWNVETGNAISGQITCIDSIFHSSSADVPDPISSKM